VLRRQLSNFTRRVARQGAPLPRRNSFRATRKDPRAICNVSNHGKSISVAITREYIIPPYSSFSSYSTHGTPPATTRAIECPLTKSKSDDVFPGPLASISSLCPSNYFALRWWPACRSN
jgi:hypothetical protein